MLVVVVFMEARSSHEASMRTALMSHSWSCRTNEPGCLRYDVSLDPLDASSFLLYQIYENEAAFRAHKELPHYAEFRLKVEPWTKSRRVLTYHLLDESGSA